MQGLNMPALRDCATPFLIVLGAVAINGGWR